MSVSSEWLLIRWVPQNNESKGGIYTWACSSQAQPLHRPQNRPLHILSAWSNQPLKIFPAFPQSTCSISLGVSGQTPQAVTREREIESIPDSFNEAF